MEKKDLEIAADLAQIDLDQDDFVKLGNAFSEMLGYFEKVKSFEVQELDSGLGLVESVPFRLDEPQEGILTNELIRQAPLLEDRLVVIPNVL